MNGSCGQITFKFNEDVLSKTSTKYAPWYVILSNRKWYRNLIVISILIETLKGLEMQNPAPEEDLDGIIIE